MHIKDAQPYYSGNIKTTKKWNGSRAISVGTDSEELELPPEMELSFWWDIKCSSKNSMVVS